MPVLTVHLPPAPPEYNVRDQDNLRGTIERALEGSWEVGAHATQHESGGSDEIDLGALAGSLIAAQVPEAVVTQHEAALTILETQITDGSLLARVGGTENITGLWDFQHASGLKIGVITERSGGAGVTIEGLLIKDAGIPESAVTAHEAALTIAESQITDGSLLARVGGTETITGLWSFSHVSGLKIDVITERSADTGVTIDGLLVKDNGIPEGAVTAHEAALTLAESQITDGSLLARIAGTENITGLWDFQHASGLKIAVITERAADGGVTIDGLLIKDNGIPEGAVTAHQAALSIAETQIPDGAILTRVGGTEAITGLWDFQHASGLKIGVITERAADAGVTIDGLLIKDNGIPEGAVTAHEGAIDHDQLTNFEVGEHFTQAAIVATGALNSGSITNGFGNIDIGASTLDAGVTTITSAIIGDLRLTSDELFQVATDGDTAAVVINHRGFNSGTTRFRDFKVRDGKNADIMVVTGSTKAVVFSGALTSAAFTATTGVFSGTTKVDADLWIQSGNDLRLYQTDNGNWSIIRANGVTHAVEIAVAGASADLTVGTGGVVTTRVGLTIGGDLDHDGDKAGFYTTAPIVKQTGVAVTDAAIHAALVNLGLIAGP